MATVRADPHLSHALQDPHERALAALDDADTNSLAAITWASTHLASVATVLHPVARRVLPHGRARLVAVVAADHALQRALWRLDHRLTGDVHVAGHEVQALEDAVRTALHEHVRQEAALVDELVAATTEKEQAALAGRLTTALRRGPTRPHPDAPVRGIAGAVAFRVDAGADRLRDLLDNRSCPTPHDVRPASVPGRWGSYVMGAPFPRTDADSDDSGVDNGSGGDAATGARRDG